MTTANEVVDQANFVIGRLGLGATLQNDEATASLTVLNNMLHSWPFAHNTLDLADTVLVEDDYIEAIVYNLAVRLAGELSIPSSVAFIAKEGWDLVKAGTFEYEDELKADRGVLHMPNSAHGSNRRGSFDFDES